MLKALVDPVSGVPRAVERRTFVLPMLVLCAAVSFSGLAFGSRLDASALVMKKMDEAGDLAKSSERELNEEVDQAQRIALVAGAAKGIFVMPLFLLLIAVALKITAWLLGRKLLFAHAFTAAAIAFLPIALFHRCSSGSSRSSRTSSSITQAAQLLPSSLAAWMPAAGPKVARALAAIDFFNLWAAALSMQGWGSRQAPKAVECPGSRLASSCTRWWRRYRRQLRDWDHDCSIVGDGVGDSDHARRGARGVAAEPRCLEGRGRAAAGDRGYHAGEVGHLPPAARSGAGGRVHRRSAEGLLDHSPDRRQQLAHVRRTRRSRCRARTAATTSSAPPSRS